MTEYYCEGEPSGGAYVQLIEWLGSHASTVGFIIDSKRDDLPARASLAVIDQALRKRKLVTEWPGTRKVGPAPRPAELRRYTLSSDVKTYLLTAASRLFEWDHPRLPRDLHFVTADGVVVCGSVTTEGYAWLELTEEQWHDFSTAAPAASRLFVPSERSRGPSSDQ